MSDAPKIAVLGSNSFSGASFSAYALERGAEVLGMSRSTEPHHAFLPYRWDGRETGFRFFPYDLNKDIDKIIALVAKEKPRYFVNFAAQSMVGQSWETPEDWFMTNVVSNVKLHNRLRGFDFLERYVHITTPEVYGGTEGFITEDAPFNPSTPYAVSRAAADMSLRTFFDAYDFPVVFTRAANVYGPGQLLYRIIPRTILFLKLGKTLSLHGGGVSRRSFIHIRDVSKATWKVMSEGKLGATYHISTNEIVSIRQLVESICEKMGASFEESVQVSEGRLGKDSAYLLDSGKIRAELDWRDEITLDQGLDACIAWVEDNLGVLKDQPVDYVHRP